jgi:quinol monooxygenase YgiN
MTVIAVARVHGVVVGRAQLLELLRRTAAAARSEPGCRSYDVAEALDAADEFVVVHAWADEAALDAHYRGAAHQAYRHEVFGLLARPSELAIHQVASTEYPVDPGPMDPRQAD